MNNKLSKGRILHLGLSNYGKYGAKNHSNHLIPNEKLKNINPQILVDKIKSITSYKHNIYYYGPASTTEVVTVLDKAHKVPPALINYPEKISFPKLETKENKVYFADYDMVQAELLILSKGHQFNQKDMAVSSIFNQYFGSGLSSIVFQEIRESKALAYSAYAYYSIPSKKEDPHYVNAYIGTQVDKLSKAVDAMLELMSNMPAVESQFETAKQSALIKMETSKTKRSNIYWNAENAKKKRI